MRKFPAHFEAPLFASLLFGLMALRVSGIATWQSLGLRSDFGSLWLTAWLSSWLIAFPAATAAAPAVRRIVVRCVQPRI